MPRKPALPAEEQNVGMGQQEEESQLENVSRLLAAVLTYLSDDEVEVIDIDYLLTHTEGLREWWDMYREKNRELIEEEIKNSLGGLSLEELERIREKIKGK